MERSENFDEFMKAVGVGLVIRKMANAASPSLDITETERKYTIKTILPSRKPRSASSWGEEFKETTADGRVVKSISTMEGETTLIHSRQGQRSVPQPKLQLPPTTYNRPH